MKKMKLTALFLSVGLLTTACTGGVPGTPGSAADASGTTAGSTSGQTGGAQSDNPVGSDISGEITVACYESMLYRAFLEEAGKQFEAAYPGTSVKIQSFSEMPEVKTTEQDGQYISAVMDEDDPQGRADYISKTSTELMSGKGADLLAMDVLPIHRYVESGQLVNLQEYIDNDPEFVKSDYRQNILDASRFKNGMWFMPLNYGFNYVTYDSTLLPEAQSSDFGPSQAYTAGELAKLGETLYNGENYIFNERAYNQDGNSDLFTRLFKENYRQFVDMENRTANFDDGSFQTLLTNISTMEDNGYIKKGLNQAMDMNEMMMSAMEAPTERFVFKPKDQFSLIMDTYQDPSLNLMFSMGAESGIETEDEIGGILAEESGVVPFSYEQAFCMNANSQNKDTAWAFLKFLLSYDIQASPGMTFSALPLHNEARRVNAEDTFKMFLTGGENLDETQQQALGNYQEMVELMSDQINGYTSWDTTIQDMVAQETAYYFDGSKSAKEVCRALQSKAGLYLDE